MDAWKDRWKFPVDLAGPGPSNRNQSQRNGINGIATGLSGRLDFVIGDDVASNTSFNKPAKKMDSSFKISNN
jgi:hypothetical protein